MPLNNTDLNARIDTLLHADNFGLDTWVPAQAATPLEITYRFETAKAEDFPWSNVADPVAFSAADEAGIRAAFAKFESVLNVKFVAAPLGEDATISFYSSPDLYTDSALLGGGRGRYKFNYKTIEGEIVYEWDASAVFRDTFDLGDPANTNLLIHEIGHTLGLKHPGNYDISAGNEPPGPFLPGDEDNNKNTMMSYNTNPDTGSNATDLMIYDIAALQKWWGVNPDTNDGRSVYRPLEGDDLMVIYDAGGTDWIRYKGTGTAQIDLREGAFSSVNGVDLAAIAYATVIENASGGKAADRLIGNDANNKLGGGKGRDYLDGGNGADVLNGGAGRDWLVAGMGADVLKGGKGADYFVFNGARDEDQNVIRDFRDGQDIIRIKALAFSDLEIAASGKGGVNTSIVLDGATEIVLKGVDSALIGVGDFDFV